MSRNPWTISVIALLAGCGFCLGLLAASASYARVAPAHDARSRPVGLLLSSTSPRAPAQGTPTPTATGTVCAAPVVLQGSLDDTDPTFNRPFGFDQGGVCQEGPTRHYDSYELQTAPGLVTASLCYGATYDSYLLIYQAPGGARIDPFVPNGCENAVTADDDYCGLQSLVSATLSGGYYYVVVSQVLTSTGSYTLTISGPGMCPLPTVTSTPLATATATETPPGVATEAATVTSTAPPGATRTSGPPTATRTPTAPRATATARATETPCGVTFSDVRPADYFYAPVQYLACHGVISGYADGTFRPYANTTRGQMVKIVVGAFNTPYHQPSNGKTFADVPPTNPFFVFVEAAAQADIVSGYACGGPGERCDDQNRPYFRPYANVTRGQLSKIDVVAAGWAVVDPPIQSFQDVLPDTAFYTFVETAYCHGVLSGYSCGAPGEPCGASGKPYFRQFTDATRGQIAKIVYGALSSPAACAAP